MKGITIPPADFIPSEKEEPDAPCAEDAERAAQLQAADQRAMLAALKAAATK